MGLQRRYRSVAGSIGAVGQDIRVGIQSNVINHLAAVNACQIPTGRWQVALMLLAELQWQCMQPDVITYRVAVGACEMYTGQWQVMLMPLAGM